MSESKVRKPRICKHCQEPPYYMTAKELKKHAQECARRKKQAA